MSTDLFAKTHKVNLRESHDAVAFHYKTKGQLLPEWLHTIKRLDKVRCFDEMNIQHVIGEDGFPQALPYDVSVPIYRIGDVVVLSHGGGLRVMKPDEFARMYEDA